MSWDETETFNELSWCPECQAPTNAEYAHVQYCQRHMPHSNGVDDDAVMEQEYIARGEAGGDSNRAVCAFLHNQGD